MAVKIDLIAPQPDSQSSLLRVHRWLKRAGDPVLLNEPLLELLGEQNVMMYIHSPGDGTLSTIMAVDGQNVLSGHVLGQVTIISKDEVDWENLDQVTNVLEDYASKSKDFRTLKDANEALGQLLGVAENPVFFNMSTEQQNKFLQNVVDQYQANRLSPADMAQHLLEGLELRTPRYAPQGPTGPALGFGMRGPAGPSPSGMGGSGLGMVPQAHAYPSYSAAPTDNQYPAFPSQAPYPPQFPPQGPQGPEPQYGQGYPPQAVPPYPVQGIPPQSLPPQPVTPTQIPSFEDDKKDE